MNPLRRVSEKHSVFSERTESFESNRVLLEARRIISEAGLGFSVRGLTEAVESCLYREVQAFLDAGFSTESEDEHGVPILSAAVRNGDLGICRLLMSYNAKVNIIARDRCSSPLLMLFLHHSRRLPSCL